MTDSKITSVEGRDHAQGVPRARRDHLEGLRLLRPDDPQGRRVLEARRTRPPPPPPEDGGDDAAKADWELWNDRTFGVIAFSCTKRTRKSEQTTQDHHGPRPKRSSSTCGRSSSLVSKSLPTILEAERQYEGLLKKPTSPIRNWIGEVEKMHDRPEDTEHGLSEQQRCVQILQHLPVQFRHVVRTQR
ncbi:hypothetical protein A4X03_0g9638, partial [Tilletia caries]